MRANDILQYKNPNTEEIRYVKVIGISKVYSSIILWKVQCSAINDLQGRSYEGLPMDMEVLAGDTLKGFCTICRDK